MAGEKAWRLVKTTKETIDCQTDWQRMITPANCHKINKILINNVAIVVPDQYSHLIELLSVSSAQNVDIYWDEDKIQVDVQTSLGGSASKPPINYVCRGSNFSVEFTANTGYRLDTITIDNEPPQSATGTDEQTVTLSNIQAVRYIYANFVQRIVNYTVIITVEGNGTTDKIGTVVVSQGGNLSIDYAPAAGNQTSSLTINQQAQTFQTAGGSIDLTNITENKEVKVIFSQKNTKKLIPFWSAGLHIEVLINGSNLPIASGGTYEIPNTATIRFRVELFSGFIWDKIIRGTSLVYLTTNFVSAVGYYEFTTNDTFDQTVSFYANPQASPTNYVVVVYIVGTGVASASPSTASVTNGQMWATNITVASGSYVSRAWIEGRAGDLSLGTNGGSLSLTTNTNQNTIVYVQTESINYTITVSAETGGHFLNTPAVSTVRAGTNWSTLVVPDAGYEIDKIMMGTEERAITNRAGETIEINGINRNYSFRATFRVKTNKLRIYVEIQHNPAEGALETKLLSTNPLPPYIEVDPNTPFTLSGRTMNGWEFSSIMLNNTYIVGTTHRSQFSYTITAEQMTINYYLVLQIITASVGT